MADLPTIPRARKTIKLFVAGNSAGNTLIENAGFLDMLTEVERATNIRFNIVGATGVASSGVVAAVIGNRIGQGGDTAAAAQDVRQLMVSFAALAKHDTSNKAFELISNWLRNGGIDLAKHLTAKDDPGDNPARLDKNPLLMLPFNPGLLTAHLPKEFGDAMRNAVKRGMPKDYDPQKIGDGFTAQLVQLDNKLDPTSRVLSFSGGDLNLNTINGLMTNIGLGPTSLLTINGAQVYAGDPSTHWGVHNMRTGNAVGTNFDLGKVPAAQDIHVAAFRHTFRRKGYDPAFFGTQVGEKQQAEFNILKQRGNVQIFPSTRVQMEYEGANFLPEATRTNYLAGRDKGSAFVRQLAAWGKLRIDFDVLKKVEKDDTAVQSFMAAVETEKKADTAPAPARQMVPRL